ncbi:monovalent cation/H(+) antiporter subunit G [Cohnella hongkongensis]|uniref:Monovalent cation/H(+) antiporter subunit G n=1 Tax=Cohnella hongkongensis TaxID=178337 RepID=A0ABV9FEX2_9BACL
MSGKEITEIVVLVMVILGTLMNLLSSWGFIRLPDVYNRSHAATKSITLGILFILLGSFIYFLFVQNYFSVRLLLGIAFVFLTAPVTGHLIVRSAYRSGIQLSDSSIMDDLAADLERERSKAEEPGQDKGQAEHSERDKGQAEASDHAKRGAGEPELGENEAEQAEKP